MCDWLVNKTTHRSYPLRGKTEEEVAREILAGIEAEPYPSFFEVEPVDRFYKSKDAAANERHARWIAHRLFLGQRIG